MRGLILVADDRCPCVFGIVQAQKHRLWDEDGDGVATTARERAHKAMAKKRLLDGVVRVSTRPFEVGGEHRGAATVVAGAPRDAPEKTTDYLRDSTARCCVAPPEVLPSTEPQRVWG